MDTYRRSGFDRRRLITEITEDQRTGRDRRSIFKHKDILHNELKETLFFQKLTSDDFHNILNISAKKTVGKNEVVFYEGDKPSEMFILIDGVLQIKLRGKELNLITPIGIVGEMGIFTGEPRSATVIAKTDCELLRFNRLELFNLLKENSSLNNHFQRGMIINLADKLNSANDIIVKIKNL
ncbi:cyclic nucleotide-binding domain-containing protein [Candidatus Omnitrophota bacterium]